MKIWISILTLTTIMMVMPALLLHADDTAIYGCSSVSVEPNILIIFDTSGSMSTEDIPSEYYDPDTTYSGSYSSNVVYRYDRRRWTIFADDVDEFSCATVKDALETDGVTEGAIYGSRGDYACGGTDKYLCLGNYRNYDASTSGEMGSRIDVAKEVITNLIEDTDDARFGLMRFNYSQGGRVIVDIESVTDNDTFKTELTDAVDDLTANGWTPLAETLAEAGLYYAGQESWFNEYRDNKDDVLTVSNTYTSPMEYRCQKNYIILMTDGAPTMDNDEKLETGSYINGDTIGDYDEDSNSGDSTFDASSDYLDDVAKYLYDNDCNPDLGTGDTSFETQNITTYTIGFQTDLELLEDTAENGGGTYYNVSSISGLSEAFESIISQISEVNTSYVAPVIPVSLMNYAYAGDSLYLGFFAPTDDGRWSGNVKKYGLNDDGDLLDVNGDDVLDDDGTILDSAQSYWSTDKDGSDVAEGGVGALLMDNANRNLYTYLGSETDLTHWDNAFSTDNSNLTYTMLDATDDTEKDEIITDIIGLDSDWKMGDVIHSTPIVVAYDTDSDGDTDESYIFVGTNGGLMHAFKDSDGSEVWGFIPPGLLGNLQLLSDSMEDHDYYVDAAPVLYDDDTNKTLFFGERRGGYDYYAIDITDPDAPEYKYTICQSFLTDTDSDIDGEEDGTDVNLGQSWTTPSAHSMKIGEDSYDKVFLMAGGYDENQDLGTPDSVDTEGKAVFAIDITDGSLSTLNFNSVNFSDMNNCIISVMGFDSNGDTYTNRIYAGDLAGNIWAFEDDDSDSTDDITGGDGTWSGRKLFCASFLDNVQRKIFYAPDAVLEDGEDMIFFGTGDRADPEETGVVNRIYAIRNDWEDSSSFTTLTEDDLVDVTENLIQMGTDEEKATVEAELESSRGWFFELENPGEKIISSVIVYNSVLYFTTYEPEDESDEDDSDPCDETSGYGTARFYAVDYENGGAVSDYDSTTETDGDGETVTYGTNDRSMVIGSSIASSPAIAISSSGAVIYVGVEGGIETIDAIEDLSMNYFYWQQAF
jgi:type IV pilus assembly protein PilY1